MIKLTVPTTPLNNAYQGGPFCLLGDVMNNVNDIPVKSATTFDEQVALLKSRGLLVADEDFAIRTLRRINYYRLSAYTLSLRTTDNHFYQGITFEQVVELYEFDRQLRHLIMEMVEQVEIAFRTHISYHIAHAYGALGYLEADNFDNHAFLEELDKEIKRSHEIFIKHHAQKYDGKIPVWIAIEVLSFGTLSKLFSNMKNEDQNQIARRNYRVPAIYLESWLKCLSYIRNICAHYGRLYNRRLTSKPRLDRNSKKLGIDQGKVFAHVYVLRELIPDRLKWRDFVTRLEALLTEYKEIVELERIGFPEDWESILVSKK